MQNHAKGSNRAWAVFGKVAAVLTAALVFVQLVRAVLPDSEFKITAYGDYSSMEIPEEVVMGLGQLDEPPPGLLSGLDHLETMWQFAIKNEGKTEVTELVLELPFAGMSRVKRDGQQPDFSEFTRDIEIGTLRPSHGIEVTAWTNSEAQWYAGGSGVLYRASDETRITHPDGVVPIRYPEKVWGLLAACARFSNRGWTFWLTSVVAVLIVGFVAVATRRSFRARAGRLGEKSHSGQE